MLRFNKWVTSLYFSSKNQLQGRSMDWGLGTVKGKIKLSPSMLFPQLEMHLQPPSVPGTGGGNTGSGIFCFITLNYFQKIRARIWIHAVCINKLALQCMYTRNNSLHLMYKYKKSMLYKSYMVCLGNSRAPAEPMRSEEPKPLITKI